MNTRICSSRTKIEIILIFAVLILLLILAILIGLLAQTKENVVGAETKVCRSQACLKEALNILDRVDVSVNPCEDFYTFACNNVEKHKQNYIYEPFKRMMVELQTNIEEMYSDPINSQDHTAVNVQKSLYQMCLNETPTEEEAFKTLKETLVKVGGWPILEGQKWNEASFDWVKTTYKLRSLGYLYSIFLDVNIVIDPDNKEKYIFKVSIPKIEDVYSKYFNTDDANEFMADVAVVFGAEVHRALGEMAQTLEFLLDLQWVQNNNEESDEDEDFYRMTIAEIQRKHGTINWIHFINQIVGVEPKLTYNDYILFPSESSIDSWMSVLIKTPKRLLANYMMWRVVENNLPFITSKLRNEKIQPRFRLKSDVKERTEYCIQLLRNSFSPSPIDIMCLRKYVSKEKYQKLLDLLEVFKNELKNLLHELTWIEDSTKVRLYSKIDNVKVVLGAPIEYYDDSVFDNFDFNISTTNFLSTLAQVRHNNLNQLYGLINKSTHSTKLFWWKMPSQVAGLYSNTIAPTIFYDENRPHYLNYGVMGLTLKNVLYKLAEGSYDWFNKSKCYSNTTGLPDYLLYQPLSHLLATTVSYNAYKKLIQTNQEELLFPLNYTPEQLFWISTGEIYCYYPRPSLNLDNTTKELYNSMIKTVINQNQELIKDFECTQVFETKCSLY